MEAYLAAALMLLAILIMLGVLAPHLYSFTTTGVFGGQGLPFTTIAQESGVRPYAKSEPPAIFVIANTQDVDTLMRTVLEINPQTPNQPLGPFEKLQQLDYDRYFAVLVVRGRTGGRSSVVVQQVVRDENRVRVGARFTDPILLQDAPAVVLEPYHLIAIPKEGDWGQPIKFELFVNGQVIAETSHVIP